MKSSSVPFLIVWDACPQTGSNNIQHIGYYFAAIK